MASLYAVIAAPDLFRLALRAGEFGVTRKCPKIARALLPNSPAFRVSHPSGAIRSLSLTDVIVYSDC